MSILEAIKTAGLKDVRLSSNKEGWRELSRDEIGNSNPANKDELDSAHINLLTAIERIENEEIKREVMFAVEDFVYAMQDDVADMIEQSYEQAYQIILEQKK